MPRPNRPIPLRDLTTYGRGRAVRLADFDYAADSPIHLTMCADDGAPFTDAEVATMVCASVERCSELRRYHLYGYTLMPDHLHVLLSPGQSRVPLSEWLCRFKSFTTNQFQRLARKRRLWQDSGNDHVCRTYETVEIVLSYIVENPVRAGLVTRWQDWAWTKVFVQL